MPQCRHTLHRALPVVNGMIAGDRRHRGGRAMQDLSGRTALVTGAAGGIGRELVRALLRAGGNVMAADVADAGLKQLADIMEGEGIGQRLATRHLDISDPRACAETVDATSDSFGPFNILVN